VKKVERILVPIAHSPGSDAVVEYACLFARGVGASLTLIHVYEPPNEMVGLVPGATVDGEAVAEHAAGDVVLDHGTAIARANGIASVDRILRRASPPAHAIVEAAGQGKFDLIVMGTHMRGRLSRLVMGSVAEQVLRSSHCPVLMVHLPPE
jgi:nucleotide-binding universal stress UspA family protein